ncbi:MAG: hypothetical protein HZB38_08685 [Planctomycetes bacterium]|nr:hypothetical protein [Planctomycetota bacterium]
MMTLATLLGMWIPLLHPIPMPTSARVWMFFPLAAAVAAVYRATRARDVAGLTWPIIRTWLNIIIGMWLIALAAYGLHMAVIRLWY